MLPSEYQTMHSMELNHWWFRGRRRVLLNFIHQLAGSRAGSLRLLDYGCGTGGNTGALASAGQVFGIEPHAAAVTFAAARGGAYFCRASGHELPFKPGTFDVVVASDVLEHMKDDLMALGEIARVLRPGGSTILSVPAHPWLYSEHDAALHHFRRYSKVALRSLLERSGLTVKRLTYWNTTLFPAIMLYRLTKRTWSDAPGSNTVPVPRPINEVLAAVVAAEAAILRFGSLPWGLTLIGVAERI